MTFRTHANHHCIAALTIGLGNIFVYVLTLLLCYIRMYVSLNSLCNSIGTRVIEIELKLID